MSIDIATLTPSDVGRGVVYYRRVVVYFPRHDQGEDGIITSWNDTYVFVRYRWSENSQATNPADLEWLTDGARPAR
jgi:hypothetical protein